MSAGEIAIYLMIMLVGFAASALYSGLETGVYVLNPVRLRLRNAYGVKAAMRLRRELRRPSRVLAVLLLGTNASNYLGSYGLAALLEGAGLDGWSLIALQLVLFTPLLFVFAETMPKELFRVHSDDWTYSLAPAITITRWLTTVILLLPCVTVATTVLGRLAGRTRRDVESARSRMSQLLKEGVGAGVLSLDQTTLADRALEMRDRTVRTVMVPWRDVSTLSLELSTASRTQRVASRKYTRLPVVDPRRPNRVVGIVSWIDVLLEQDRPTAEIMREPLTIAPGTRLLEAMTTLRHQHRAIAIVQNDAGEALGIVTLKDLVEPLTGELVAW